MLPDLGGLRLGRAGRRDERDECEPTGPFAALSEADADAMREAGEHDAITLDFLEPNRHRGQEGATFRLATRGRGRSRAERRWNYFDAKALAQHVRVQTRMHHHARDPVLNTLIPPSEVRLLLQAYPEPDAEYEPEEEEEGEPGDGWGGAGPAPFWLQRTGPGRRRLRLPLARPPLFGWRTAFQRGALYSAAGNLLPTQAASLVPRRLQVYSFVGVGLPVGVDANGQVTNLFDWLESAHVSAPPGDLSALYAALLPGLGGYQPRRVLQLLDRAYRAVRSERRAIAGLVDGDGPGEGLITSTFGPEVVLDNNGAVERPRPGSPWLLQLDFKVQLVRLLVLDRIEHAAGANLGPSVLDRLVRELAENELNRNVALAADPEAAAREAARAWAAESATPELKAMLAPPPVAEPGREWLQWHGRPEHNNEPTAVTWKHVLAVSIECVERLIRHQIDEHALADDERPLAERPRAFELAAPSFADFTAAEQQGLYDLASPVARLAHAYTPPQPEMTNLANSEWTASSWWYDYREHTITTIQNCYASVPIAYYTDDPELRA